MITVMRAFAFCLASLLGAGAGGLPAADVSTPPLSRLVIMRVQRDSVDVVFNDFAAAADRAGLKCHHWSMVGYRENFCDAGGNVSVVGMRASEPPGTDPENVALEVHAAGHGVDRDRDLAAIGDRIIDEVKAATKGNAGVDNVRECGKAPAC
jgi:hypothetical protein